MAPVNNLTQIVSQPRPEKRGRFNEKYYSLLFSRVLALGGVLLGYAILIYVDTNKEVGDVDHLKVFATPELADEWFKENDPEGVAFGYEVIE